MSPSWYGRTVRVSLSLGVLLVAAFLGMRSIELGLSEGNGRPRISVITEHYGATAERIERTITVPLEQALAELYGVQRIVSSSEYGRSRVDLTFSEAEVIEELYLEVRTAVERAALLFPRSARKPRILSSSSTRRPVFIVAVDAAHRSPRQLRAHIERSIKPQYSRIPGTGEIEIAGGALEEIHIRLDPQATAKAGLHFPDVARALSGQNLSSPSGVLQEGRFEVPLLLRGRFTTTDEIHSLEITRSGESAVALERIARITRAERRPETVSRINGEKRLALYIRSDGSSNSLTLSRALRACTAELELSETERFEVVYDSGRRVEQAMTALLRSIVLSLTLVLLLLFLTTGKLGQAAALGMLLPATLLVAVGTLGFAGLDADEFVLAGFALGIGSIVDAGIILSERHCPRRGGDYLAVHECAPVLLSSAATSVIALLPLLLIRRHIAGLGQIVAAVAVLLAASVLMTLLFLPTYLPRSSSISRPIIKTGSSMPLFYPQGASTRLRHRGQAFGRRLFYRMVLLVQSAPPAVLLPGMVLIAGGIASAGSAGFDFTRSPKEDSLYIHVEFESGASSASVDARMTRYADKLRHIEGIQRTETLARRDNANCTVTFDATVISWTAAARAAERIGAGIPGGSVHFPYSNREQRLVLQITMTGDDTGRLQQHASSAAASLSGHPQVRETVLHFKSPPPAFRFIVSPRKAALHGIAPAAIGRTLQWCVSGPVAVKWIEHGDEKDIRVIGNETARESVAALRTLSIPGPHGSSTRLTELGGFIREERPARIRRWNRQRSASFSVICEGMPAGEAAEFLWKRLSTIETPPGYAFHIDSRVEELESRFRLLGRAFLLALLSIYLLLAAYFESLRLPIIALTIVPVSLAVPAIALRLSGEALTIPVIVGFVILSGIAVNSSLLVVEDFRNARLRGAAPQRAVRTALRRRAAPLLLTAGTTILAALPLLLACRESFTARLAFVMFWGAGGALFSSLLFLPALILQYPGLSRSPQAFRENR